MSEYKKKFKLNKWIKNTFNRFRRSINARITFFMIFAISISNALAGAVLIVIPNTPLFDKWNMKNWQLVLIAIGISFVGSSVASIFINRNFLHPLREIIEGTKQISLGNYSVRLGDNISDFTRESEIGTLMDNFNDMAYELNSTEIFRNDFIHNFSHEFKTPIISIRGFARQLYNGNLNDEQTKEFSKIIVDESEHLSAMATNVLLLSKLETQGVISDKKEFYLDEQIRNCMLMFEEQWSLKNLTIDMDELDEIKYYQNEELTSHIWINLIGNAIKFTPENGTIKVEGHIGNGNIWIAITDTGIGMNPQTAAHVFEKFYQGDSSHSTAGNGLGLPLVQKIVTMLDGKISVKSQEGVGSTFAVSFPQYTAQY